MANVCSKIIQNCKIWYDIVWFLYAVRSIANLDLVNSFLYLQIFLTPLFLTPSDPPVGFPIVGQTTLPQIQGRDPWVFVMLSCTCYKQEDPSWGICATTGRTLWSSFPWFTICNFHSHSFISCHVERPKLWRWRKWDI